MAEDATLEYMKFGAFILALSVPLQAHAEKAEDAFYVWQQLWSDPVLEAVANEWPATLYPLATVVPESGASPLANIPWNALSTRTHRTIPVFRIPLKAFQRLDLAEELAAATSQLRQHMDPIQLEEIQFDLDCPERLLDRYLELVEVYRRRHPNLRLSITALPAHLKHEAFRRLAAATDYYVLQVHGIEIPKHMDDRTELLNMRTAEEALRQAEQIGRPYLVALPCYAYELNFDPATGKFLFLTAEKPSRRTETTKHRVAARNADLVELRKKIQALEHAHGVVWFRLPVEGDRLCLPRAALASIQSGNTPQSEVECNIVPVNTSAIELELVNKNTIAFHHATVRLDWPDPAGSYDLFQNIEALRPTPGKLPTELVVPMPPPGKTIKLGWFQSSPLNHPEIEVNLR